MRYDPTTFERRQPVDDAALERVISQAPAAPSELLPCQSAPYFAAPSAPDVPGAVGGLIAASYVTLIGTLAIATTGYILIGIYFEERDLVAQFGEQYLRYRRQVGMLFPKGRGAVAQAGEGRHHRVS
jgi:hypothetical protein